jgi:hypothetical protein
MAIEETEYPDVLNEGDVFLNLFSVHETTQDKSNIYISKGNDNKQFEDFLKYELGEEFPSGQQFLSIDKKRLISILEDFFGHSITAENYQNLIFNLSHIYEDGKLLKNIELFEMEDTDKNEKVSILSYEKIHNSGEVSKNQGIYSKIKVYNWDGSQDTFRNEFELALNYMKDTFSDAHKREWLQTQWSKINQTEEKVEQKSNYKSARGLFNNIYDLMKDKHDIYYNAINGKYDNIQDLAKSMSQYNAELYDLKDEIEKYAKDHEIKDIAFNLIYNLGAELFSATERGELLFINSFTSNR